MYDILDAEEENRYQITASQKEEVVINFQIQTGTIKVQVRDFSKVDITKSAKKNTLRIVVPPEDVKGSPQ